MADNQKALAAIANAMDPAKLRILNENAERLGVSEIKDAAFKRLVEILPAEQPGSIEHDWGVILPF